jgi:hypothetical protein
MPIYNAPPSYPLGKVIVKSYPPDSLYSDLFGVLACKVTYLHESLLTVAGTAVEFNHVPLYKSADDCIISSVLNEALIVSSYQFVQTGYFEFITATNP